MTPTAELSRPRADRVNGAPSAARPPSPLQAIARHPFLTLLPILLMVAGAVAFGLERKPIFTSEARVGVGELSPSAQTVAGIVEANQQLASAFSRAIDAQRVLTPVARELDVTTAEVERRLDATPVPESPVLVVSGAGPSKAEAVALTQVGMSALVRYIRALGDTDAEAERLLRELTEARREVERLRAETLEPAASPELEAAELRAQSLRAQYLDTTQSPGATPITVLNPAESATNDRRKVLQLAIVVAVLGGIAVGAALATLREGRLRRCPAPAH
jgi:hypothetical protein